MWELDYKESECQRIDAFELWCWRRLLWVPWTTRRSNQSILKEISPEYFLEGLMLKLKTPILCPPDAKNWLTRKDPDVRKDWRWEEKGMTEWDGWMASPNQWTCVWASSGSWWWTGRPGMLQFTGSQRVRHDWATELNWTENQTLYLTETFRNIRFFQSSCKNPGYRSPGFPCILKEIQSF